VKNVKIAVDRLQVRLRGGSEGSARALAPALGASLMEALKDASGLRGATSVRVAQSGPANAGRIAGAVAAALKRV
jgi:hypothetical protein